MARGDGKIDGGGVGNLRELHFVIVTTTWWQRQLNGWRRLLDSGVDTATEN